MRQASWQDRVDALGRAGYGRYDERTSAMLGDAAGQLLDYWGGDLRKLRDDAGGDPKRIHALLTGFTARPATWRGCHLLWCGFPAGLALRRRSDRPAAAHEARRLSS